MKTLSENYTVEKAVCLVAECFDYAVNYCDIAGDDFWNYLIISGVSKQIENHNPKIVLGRSSIEIVIDILDKMNVAYTEHEYIAYDRSPEYWSGWALSQFQMESGLSYKKLHQLIGFTEILGMYRTLHEAPIEKFFDIINKRLSGRIAGLKLQRERMGLSQSELSAQSGISLKTIQSYEQGQKEIKRAKIETLNIFADILACEIEDLF